jgi:hypothetical protein
MNDEDDTAAALALALRDAPEPARDAIRSTVALVTRTLLEQMAETMDNRWPDATPADALGKLLAGDQNAISFLDHVSEQLFALLGIDGKDLLQ